MTTVAVLVLVEVPEVRDPENLAETAVKQAISRAFSASLVGKPPPKPGVDVLLRDGSLASCRFHIVMEINAFMRSGGLRMALSRLRGKKD